MQPTSVLGRLLREVSWEGNAKHYREGGRGFENVLTAEVFQALDFLPRDAFLGEIVRSATSSNRGTLDRLASEIEEARLHLLPGDLVLARSPRTGKASLTVQPDVIVETPSVYCLVEAKRIRRGAFQVEQLAREYIAALQEAGTRQPLVLLVLPDDPPVPIRGNGRMAVRDAVDFRLGAVMERCGQELQSVEQLSERIDAVFAHTTWQRMYDQIERARSAYAVSGDGLSGTVARLASAAMESIRWHA